MRYDSDDEWLLSACCLCLLFVRANCDVCGGGGVKTGQPFTRKYFLFCSSSSYLSCVRACDEAKDVCATTTGYYVH